MSSDYLAEIKRRESSMNPERSGSEFEIPVLPLRDVVYLHMVIPFVAGQNLSVVWKAAMDHDKKIMLVAQKEVFNG
ncbi:hypothetical protein ACNKHU_02375 [Shigella flexneri]